MLIRSLYNSFYSGKSIFKLKPLHYVLSISLASYLGYRFGYEISDKEDKEKFLVPFKNEDSLMNLVLNKEKKPSLVYYYIPGHGKSHFFREAVLNVASDINEKVNFMKINCASHFDLCKQKPITSYPHVELYVPLDEAESGFEMIPYGTKFYNEDAIYSFLEESFIIKKQTDPLRGLIEVHRKAFEETKENR